MKGKIVLIHFPFTDLTSTKLRPALVLHENEKDVIVAFISSRKTKTRPFDILITENHAEFKKTGLKVPSYLKLDKIATLSKELIIGEIGEIGPKLKKEVSEGISKTLIL